MAEEERSGTPQDLAGRPAPNQVFGEPVRQGDTVLVPVAKTRFGRIVGDRGVGVVGKPVGAFSVSADGKVAWHPAVSVNRIVLGGQIALAVALVAFAVAFRRRR